MVSSSLEYCSILFIHCIIQELSCVGICVLVDSTFTVIVVLAIYYINHFCNDTFDLFWLPRRVSIHVNFLLGLSVFLVLHPLSFCVLALDNVALI